MIVRFRIFFLALIIALHTAGCDNSKKSRERQAASLTEEVQLEEKLETPKKPGRWRKFRTHKFDPTLSEKQRKIVKQLESIGYLGGVKKAPEGKGGVVRFSKNNSFAGVNFYVSGHQSEAVLMDMLGNVLHRWQYDFWKAWPDFPVPKDLEYTQFWRRAHLYPNGDILAIFEGLGIIKLDKDSNLLWATPCRAHHDIEVLDNGDIYILTREARLLPRINKKEPVLEDFVSILNPDGTERQRISLLESFENSSFRSSLPEKYHKNDLFHTNTLEVLDGSIANQIPEFKAGNILTAMLFLNTIAVVDPVQKKVVWIYKGTSYGKHDPQLLENGSLMYFNNKFKPGASRVLELDPLTKVSKSIYQGSKESPFYSEFCGSAQRFPNGNTLITESDNGRALEITPEREIVWEFTNPERTGPNKKFIAVLFDLIRFPEDYVKGWLPKK